MYLVKRVFKLIESKFVFIYLFCNCFDYNKAIFLDKNHPYTLLTSWMSKLPVIVEDESYMVNGNWLGQLKLANTWFKTIINFNSKSEAKAYCALFILYRLGFFNPERQKY